LAWIYIKGGKGMKLTYLILTLLFAVTAFAAEPTKEDLTGRLPVEVPQSAAFTLLGVSPDNVIEPQSGRELGVALLQGLDSNGNFQSGYALEARPYLWFQDTYISEQNLPNRLLSGLKFSFATAKGLDNADKANRYALGVNWTYQFDDPVFSSDLKQCVLGTADKYLPLTPGGPINKQALDAAIAECEKKYVRWNSSAIAVGAAGHKSKEIETDLDRSGWGDWITGSYAIGKTAELTAHYREVKHQLVPTEVGLISADSKIAALRLRYGNDKIHGILESAWIKDQQQTGKNNYTRASAGVEFDMGGGFWFRLAYGDTFGSEAKKEEFFSGQLRMGFGEKPLYTPGQ
jgi:hypothetical protein